MADQNQQMADIMQQVNYELERYGRLTGSTADSLRDAQVGVEGFSQAVRKVPIALTDSVGKMVKTLNTGERGAKAYNDAVSSMADAASAATTVLTAMIPGGPIVKMLIMGLGKLASAAIKAASEVYKLATEQADRQYDAYMKLAQSGAAAAGGTTQFAQQLRKLSVPLQDLDGYIRMIGENSQDLALFGGSVTRGVADFVELRNAMKPFRLELMNLGLSTEQQNEAVLKFISLQTRLGNAGRLQSQSYEQTAAAAKRYIEEQDVLTRLTGVERKEREKTLMDAMRNQRFAATLDDLERQGKKEEAKALRDSMALIGETAGPATAKAFQDAVTGFITPESQKILMASQGVVQEQIALIKEGRVKTDKEFADSNERMIKSLGRASQDFNQLAQIGIFDKIFGPYEESRRAQQFIDKKDQDLATRILKIRQEQAAQGVGIDKRLLDANKIRLNQLDTQLNKEGAVDKAIDAAQSAALALSEAMLAVSESALAAATGLSEVKKESKGFWAKILEFFGISTETRPKTEQEKALEAADEAARQAMERAEAERRATTETRKAAESALDAERKRFSEAQDQVDRAKAQLQGVGTQPGVNFEVQRLQRLERVATEKLEAAKASGKPEDIKKAQQEADRARANLQASMDEQARLQRIVAEQVQTVDAARLEIAKRETALAEARRLEAEAQKVEATKTRERLKAQNQMGMGGERPDAVKALEADQNRRRREKDTADLKKVETTLQGVRDTIQGNNERIAKLDKTRDKLQIEQLERINESMTRRTQELEAEAKALKEKLKANPPPAQPVAARPPATGFGDDDTSVFPTTAPTKPGAPAPTKPGAPATAQPGASAGAVPSTARPAPPKTKPMKVDQAQLEAMGLRIKKGDVQREQGDIDPRVIKLAKDIQNNLKGFVHFTGFNDNFHQENAPGSHTKGLAMDFILNRKPSVEEGKDVVSYLKELGASRVIDEYNFPSAKSTGGHFHAEVAAYAKGGIIPGPTIALMGERQPEAVVPLPDGKTIPVTLDTALTDGIEKLSAILSTTDLQAASAIRENNNSGANTVVIQSGISDADTYLADEIEKFSRVFGNIQTQLGKDLPEAIRLTQRDVMAPGGIGATVAGYNQYTGYNMGGMTTDLTAVKEIAASLGAFDRATETITDPNTWRQILNTGIATNMQIGMAEFGTKMIPGIGNEIGERIKEIVETSNNQADVSQALRAVTEEFKTMMQGVVNMSQGDPGRTMVLQTLLSELIKEQRTNNDITKKMLQVARN
jgi:hypothetical protein